MPFPRAAKTRLSRPRRVARRLPATWSSGSAKAGPAGPSSQRAWGKDCTPQGWPATAVADAGDVRPLQHHRRGRPRGRGGEALCRERDRSETESPFYGIHTRAKLRRSNNATVAELV